MINARECALKILYKIETRSAYSNIAVDEVIGRNIMDTLDRGFATQLVYGTLRHQNTLDHIMKLFLESPDRFARMNKWLLVILRMGILQILYLDKVPFYSAVDEAVKLTKQYGPPGASRFINAVLRNVCEQHEEVLRFDGMEEIQALALRTSHPEWLVRHWHRQYEAKELERLLRANNFAPAMTIRVNTLKTRPEAIMAALTDLQPEKVPIVPEGIIVRRATELTSLSIFQEGHFYIQDETSMLVAHVLDPQPLEVIFDLCASPGGKTTHIATLANNEALVVAFDRFSHKINRIKENCRRLGVTSVTMKVQDILKMREVRKAHRVLLDVPCSCTGIIRRHPELKWQITPEVIHELAGVQKQLLNAASGYVAPGGILVYSACTLEAEETMDVIKDFLESRSDFVLDPFPDQVIGWLDEALREHTGREGWMQFLPHRHGTDGFFVARLRRKK